MRNRIYLFAIVLALLAMPAFSQEAEKKSDSSSTTSAQQAPKHYYKLHFVLKEMADGNVINQRAFTLGLAASTAPDYSDRSSLRAGTRIPTPGGEKPEYVDIGTNLDVSRALEKPDGLQLFVSTEISTPTTDTIPNSGPVAFRQFRANSYVLAPIGKPTIVFTADDTASKHRFELQVTPVLEH